MTQIDFGLLANGQNSFDRAQENGRQIAASVAQALEQGQAARQARELRGMLAQVYTNPEGADDAMAQIFQRDPALGMRLQEFRDSRAFNRSMTEYIGASYSGNALTGAMTGNSPGQGGALGGVGGGIVATPEQQAQQGGGGALSLQGTPGQPQRNALLGALPPVGPGASFGEAFAPLAPGASQPQAQPAQMAPQGQEAGVDLSVLGQPQNGRDRAFLAMVQRDPIRALQIESTLRDNFIERARGEREFYTLAVEELSRVTDQAGWQAALARVGPLAQGMGTDLSSIPTTYPGPEAVRQMLENALPVKERLDFILRETDVEADNTRQDRSTESLIGSRNAQVANTRRGQDIASADRRRGQDMTDSRARSGRSSGRGGGGSAGGVTVRQGERTATGADGQTLVVRDGRWVAARAR